MESDKDKQNKDKDTETGREKKFLNGWTTEQERLMSEWSDIAMCYRWLHDHSEKIYHSKTLWINIPVIVLSTLGGTANFGIQSIFSDDASKQLASFAIGGVSLLAGLLTTINNYLRYPQLEESNRVASIAWGKFQRLIAVELSLHPDERMDSMDFLKVCRSDLDRLIEQSPPIPPPAIRLFEFRFGSIKELKKPDICGALEHTRVYESSETRLKQVAVDAALLLRQRKNTLAELLSPKIQEQIATQIHARMSDELDARKMQLEEEIISKKEEERRVEEALQDRQRKLHEELDAEKRALQREKAVSPVSPVPPVQPVQRSTFEHRLQRRHFPSTMETRTSPPFSTNPLFTHPSIPLSARSSLPRFPSQQDADSHPIMIPESSQPYSKSVDSSPVMQPQLGPNPTEFALPDHQNTVIVPQ
jgi:hypothetical protein